MKKIFNFSFILIFAVIFLFSACNKEHIHDFSHSSVVVSPTENENGYTKHICKCKVYEKDNYTCLISFENVQVDSYIVNINDEFLGIENATEYRLYDSENDYTNIYKGQKITKSSKITVIYDSLIEDTSFDDVITKIKKLEEISKEYSPSNYQIRTMQYLRQLRYASGEWNTFGGTLENDFQDFVLNNQGSYDLSSLQSINYNTNPKTQEKVDFIHMVAIMNVVIKGSLTNNTINDLVGWGGDLCQLVLELKNTGLSGSALEDKANSLFNSENSSFSSQDLLADMDALNIASIYDSLVSEKQSISYAISQYYKTTTLYARKQNFLSIAFPDFVENQTQFESTISDRLSSNLYIQIWCARNGLSFANDSQYINSAISVFAKYFTN